MAYSGLMLDFGGVILKTPFEMHRLVEKKLNLPNHSLNWYGPFDPYSDLLWQRMQADEITEQDYWKSKSLEVGKLTREKWSLRDYMNCCYRGFDEEEIIREEAKALVSEVKKWNISVGILTNELEYFHGIEWMDSLKILNEMDYLVDGSKTKILKPNPKAYEIAIEESGLKKKEIIFIDDQRRNVKGANDINLFTIHFDVTSPKTSFESALTLFELN
tara:strand:+ start:55 stop:705 length:651 start_codon:yes stop_codon:yes gene_type:complete